MNYQTIFVFGIQESINSYYKTEYKWLDWASVFLYRVNIPSFYGL